MWKEKKKLFGDNIDLTLVTPSKWLKGLVEKSFLKNHPVYVINNGIDLMAFHPYEVDDKKGITILGVAMGWGKRKGLDVFQKLAEKLPESYKIVMVGTDEIVDKDLPARILSIHRTHDQNELARIYSEADVFVNPTREDTFPTTNIEALACGTPVITFRTGGSPEIIDETCGSVVDCDDVDALIEEIVRVCETHPYAEDDCIKRGNMFNNHDRFAEYVNLYENLWGGVQLSSNTDS
jgi:glycosyltransferase involved in cell wall biosynthesis